MNIWSFTGHRPPRLGLDYTRASRNRLVKFAESVLIDIKCEYAITGGALGWDQCIAEACGLLGIPYSIYIPFSSFGNKWPQESIIHLNHLLQTAKVTKTICENVTNFNEAYILRDKAMVDDSDKICALYDGVPKGGTYKTVSYAKTQKKPVTNVWDLWSR